VADIVVLVDDLFFQSKIVETARHTGVELKLCGTPDSFMAEIERSAPALAIVDLNARANPLSAIERLQAAGNQVPVIGYLSHVQTELAERAKAAGCREVMPRSKFSMNLAAILASAKSTNAKPQ
jgi:DNA-binding NarL/FixJ family response regulator